jgi:hypothetical protein
VAVTGAPSSRAHERGRTHEREARERLIALVKRHPVFRDVSARLVADLLERHPIERLSEAGIPMEPYAVLGITGGPVQLATSRKTLNVTEFDVLSVPLAGGVWVRDDDRIDWTRSWILPGPDPVYVCALPKDFHLELPQVLANALDRDAARKLGTFGASLELQEPAPLLIWMTTERAGTLPLDALTYLLAEAVARDLPFPVAIVTCGRADGLRAERWNGTAFAPVHWQPTLPIDPDDLRALVCDDGDPSTRRGRIFVVHVDDPLQLPSPEHPDYGFASETRFDQAVLVTAAVPTEVSPELRKLLAPSVRRTKESERLSFCAVTPTVLIDPAAAGARFAVYEAPTDDTLAADDAAGERARLFREACRLRIDPDAVATAWRTRRSSAAFARQIDARLRTRIHRWARAVTQRRVGLALSGGGACAYRLAGLLKRLDEAGVPVDVVAGLSGGALMGAFYCAEGRAGLDKAIERGATAGALLPLLSLSSWFMEAMVDRELGGAPIDLLEVRYVPITLELCAGAQPCARVVTAGTVGEAVRVSGTLPLMFGPTTKEGRRFADGGGAALIPAEIVRCAGADLSVSYNLMAEPADGDPLEHLPFHLGRVARCLPLVGRVVDAWVWMSSLWARASREFGDCVDVPIRFCDDRVEPFEAFAWWRASKIADDAYWDEEVKARVLEIRARWERLQIRWP